MNKFLHEKRLTLAAALAILEYVSFWAYSIWMWVAVGFTASSLVWIVVDIFLFGGIVLGIYKKNKALVVSLVLIELGYDGLSFSISQLGTISTLGTVFSAEGGWAAGMYNIFFLLMAVLLLASVLILAFKAIRWNETLEKVLKITYVSAFVFFVLSFVFDIITMVQYGNGYFVIFLDLMLMFIFMECYVSIDYVLEKE